MASLSLTSSVWKPVTNNVVGRKQITRKSSSLFIKCSATNNNNCESTPFFLSPSDELYKIWLSLLNMTTGVPERTTGRDFRKGSPVSLPEDTPERALRFGLTLDKSTRHSSEPHAMPCSTSTVPGIVYEHCSSNVYKYLSSNVHKYLSFKTLEVFNPTTTFHLHSYHRNIPLLILTQELGLGTTPRRG
nr:hypothetical protein [Tanacetum cinerariifolium]